MKIREIILEKRRPRKKGQPAKSDKHPDLYTDENPKGTIHGLKFATVKDAENSVNIIKKSGKTHAHKIQAAIAMEQRAKAADKKSAAMVYRRYINAMKKKTKQMKEVGPVAGALARAAGYGAASAVMDRVKKKMQDETKEAPKGTYFTKTGNLVKGKLTKAARAKGARQTDPKDKMRKKVPKVTQYNERGIVTKQNATMDVPVGGEYMNMPKLKLGKEGRPPVIKYGKNK